jgi:hypothetical protein
MNAVAKHEPEIHSPAELQRVEPNRPVTPMDMISAAIERGAGLDVVEKLMALQERWEASQGRKAFDAAVSAAKAEMTPVLKTAKGHNEKRYADLAAIAKAVDPILSKHGLSYRFRSGQSDRIHVTCILAHRDGHSEETTLAGPPDTSGSKNAIQAIGSTVTYLSRYSLVQALGLATMTDDDDGKGHAAAEPISAEQLAKLRKLVDDFEADEPRFAKFMKVESLEALPSSKFDAAVKELNAFGARQRGAK